MINEIFSIRNILIYFLAINIIAFFTMGYDKHQAQKGGWRVSEWTLFVLCFLGGSIGGIAGMYAFRHKTKKWYFKYGFPIILAIELVAIIALYMTGKFA